MHSGTTGAKYSAEKQIYGAGFIILRLAVISFIVRICFVALYSFVVVPISHFLLFVFPSQTIHTFYVFSFFTPFSPFRRFPFSSLSLRPVRLFLCPPFPLFTVSLLKKVSLQVNVIIRT